jgi:chromosome partitioning protein
VNQLIKFSERPRLKHGRVVAVGNLKGGTGKSTVSVNLACALAAAGKTTAILDTDPQSTAARWAELEKLPVACYPAPLESLDVVGGWIADSEELRFKHDILVVDLPSVVVPALGAAFMIADVIVVPVGTSLPDLDGTQRVLQYVELAHRERRKHPPQIVLVPTRVTPDTPDPIGTVSRHLGLARELIAPALSHHVAFQEAYAWGEWVGSLAPDSPPHRQIREVAAFVLDRLERMEPAPLWLGGKARRLRLDLVHDALDDPFGEELGEQHRPRSWWRRLLFRR